jgi:hypothetical protein
MFRRTLSAMGNLGALGDSWRFQPTLRLGPRKLHPHRPVGRSLTEGCAVISGHFLVRGLGPCHAALRRVGGQRVSWNCSNQFRRSGQRDDRRRLLLNEELCRTGTGGSRSRSQRAGQRELLARKSPNYGDDALDEQPRASDLVPRRLPAYFLLLLLGLAFVGGIEALSVWVPTLPPFAADDRAGAFSLDGPGSLTAWFSSATLLAAALASVLVYSVRRYRTDDYRGYYRIWLWAATCWCLMSIDATAGLREEFKEAMTWLTGAALYGDGSLWWAVPYLVLLSALGSRLAVDTWPARLSTAALSTALACLTLAVAAQLGWVPLEDGAHGTMLAAGAEMFGYWMLMLATALHARYVVLDAEGLLPRPEPKVELDLEEETSGELDAIEAREWIAIDSPHQSPTPVLKRRAAVKPEPEFDAADAAAAIGRKLTKQEKKALRQRLTRERLQREQAQQRKWA